MVFRQSLKSLFKEKFENKVLAKVIDQSIFMEKISKVRKFEEKIFGVREIFGK